MSGTKNTIFKIQRLKKNIFKFQGLQKYIPEIQ